MKTITSITLSVSLAVGLAVGANSAVASLTGLFFFTEPYSLGPYVEEMCQNSNCYDYGGYERPPATPQPPGNFGDWSLVTEGYEGYAIISSSVSHVEVSYQLPFDYGRWIDPTGEVVTDYEAMIQVVSLGVVNEILSVKWEDADASDNPPTNTVMIFNFETDLNLTPVSGENIYTALKNESGYTFLEDLLYGDGMTIDSPGLTLDVAMVSVPEPSSLVLLGIGLAGLIRRMKLQGR